MAIWYILEPFGNLELSCYIFPRFGTLYQEKSGSPAVNSRAENLRRKPNVTFLKRHFPRLSRHKDRAQLERTGQRWVAAQGDQIGPIFAHWAIIFFGQIFYHRST
jgi:hypothetical protein